MAPRAMSFNFDEAAHESRSTPIAAREGLAQELHSSEKQMCATVQCESSAASMELHLPQINAKAHPAGDAKSPGDATSNVDLLLAQLTAQIASGNEPALARLYDKTSQIIYGLALRILRDPSAAEEITLDVYLQIWRTAQNYDASRGKVLSWLITIARSRAIDYLRTRKARRADCEQDLDSMLEPADSRSSPESATIEKSRSAFVQTALAQLPSEQRQALSLAYYSGLSQTEIASRTGLPLGTVKTRMRLGMIRMRELLSPLVINL